VKREQQFGWLARGVRQLHSVAGPRCTRVHAPLSSPLDDFFLSVLKRHETQKVAIFRHLYQEGISAGFFWTRLFATEQILQKPGENFLIFFLIFVS